MNPSIFQQAQAAVASNISANETLTKHSRSSKLQALIEKGSAIAGPAIAAVGIMLGTAAIGGNDVSAQNYYGNQDPVAAQRAHAEMLERQARDARNEAQRLEQQQRYQSQNSQRIYADLAANISGQVAGANGSYTQANAAQNAARNAVNMYGNNNASVADRAAMGSNIGANLANMATGQNGYGNPAARSVGSIAGALAGAAWGMFDGQRQQSELQERQAMAMQAERASAMARQAQQQAQQQAQRQAQYQQNNRNVSYQQPQAQPGEIVWRKVTPGSGAYQPAGVQRQITTVDPASLGLPAVVVQVVHQTGTAIVAPGQRAMQPEVGRDPLAKNVFDSIQKMADRMADRASTVMLMDSMRNDGASPTEVGRYSQRLVEQDVATRQSIKESIDATNRAAVQGNFNTQPVLEMIGTIIKTAYIPDSTINYRANNRSGLAPR